MNVILLYENPKKQERWATKDYANDYVRNPREISCQQYQHEENAC